MEASQETPSSRRSASRMGSRSSTHILRLAAHDLGRAGARYSRSTWNSGPQALWGFAQHAELGAEFRRLHARFWNAARAKMLELRREQSLKARQSWTKLWLPDAGRPERFLPCPASPLALPWSIMLSDSSRWLKESAVLRSATRKLLSGRGNQARCNRKIGLFAFCADGPTAEAPMI